MNWKGLIAVVLVSFATMALVARVPMLRSLAGI